VQNRKRLPNSRAEEESSFAVANELSEQCGNRRVKIDLTIRIHCLEPLFDLPTTTFCWTWSVKKSAEMCLSISMPSASPILKPAAPQRMKITRFRGFLHLATVNAM